MLSQYNTWILIGVMEEKSSRVIEVLLAAVRPIQLLTGKVLGIGLVAFAQASLIVTFALVLAKSVGSDPPPRHRAPVLVSTLAWLVLGYAFYPLGLCCRRFPGRTPGPGPKLGVPLEPADHLRLYHGPHGCRFGQSVQLVQGPRLLAPDAPFAMPVLVGLGAVALWEFLASVLISLVCTVGVARLATAIYKRAILRTGRRVKLREVLARRAA